MSAAPVNLACMRIAVTARSLGPFSWAMESLRYARLSAKQDAVNGLDLTRSMKMDKM